MVIMLWLVKLWWLEVIIGGLIIVRSIFSFSILGIVVGGVILTFGLIFRIVMSSESMKKRIERNL